MSPQEIPFLHLHAQRHPHDEAYLIANRLALLRLQGALTYALGTGKRASVELFVNDGEGFEVVIQPDDSPCLPGHRWARRVTPYTVEPSQERDPHKLQPWDETPLPPQQPAPVASPPAPTWDTPRIVKVYSDPHDPLRLVLVTVRTPAEMAHLGQALQDYVRLETAATEGTGPDPGTLSEFLEERQFTLPLTHSTEWPFEQPLGE